MNPELEPELTDLPPWPSELNEPAAALGRPKAVFRTTTVSAIVRMILGMIVFLLGVGLHISHWVFGMNPVCAIIFFLFSLPLTGAGMMYSAWRDRGMWVLVYPTGLLLWQRGQTLSIPWDELDSVSLMRVTQCEAVRLRRGRYREPDGAWLPVVKSKSWGLGWKLELRRFDGEVAHFPETIPDIERLSRIIQTESFIRVWERIRVALSAGEEFAFGPLLVSTRGLRYDGGRLSWNRVQEAFVDRSRFCIRPSDDMRVWAALHIEEIPNPHVLMALIAYGPPILEEDDRPRRSRKRDVVGDE